MKRRSIVLVELAPSGGLFQFALQLGAALAARGERIELWTGPRPEADSPEPGLVVRSVLPTWHPADAAPRSRIVRSCRRPVRALQLVLAWLVLGVRLIGARPRAVVWSHWRFGFEPMFVVLLAKLLRRTIFGMVAHEPVPRSDAKDTSTPKSGRMLNALFTAAWRQMDVAFALGPRTRELVIGHWQPRCAVHVIPHGDEGVLNGDGAVLSAEDTDPVALFFGTWSTYKGIDVLLAAFESVRRDLPEARLLLAGAVGADVDYQALLRRAQAIGNVDVQAGYVPVADVPALVGSARVLVTPYLRASQSGVIHLAYTFGRPVVASDVGDLSEVVRDGETGFLVPTGDPVALAAAMRKLLSDNSLAARMGECGRRGLAEAWGTAAATMMHALEEVEDS